MNFKNNGKPSITNEKEYNTNLKQRNIRKIKSTYITDCELENLLNV